MKSATKKSVRQAPRAAAPKRVRTTVGDLIAAAIDTVGSAHDALDLFTAKSPLQRALRQRLVLE